jgi:DNA-binding NarL/FixJ family response regulator
LPKDANAEELFFAIESIKSTGYYFSNMSPIDYMKVNSMPDLNNNEKQFLINCCEDLTYKQISEKMGLSQRTVETYRDNLFEKLKVNSRTGLVMFAVKNGLA